MLSDDTIKDISVGQDFGDSLVTILNTTKMVKDKKKFMEEQKRLKDAEWKETRQGSGKSVGTVEKARIIKRVEGTLSKYIIGKTYYPILLGYSIKQTWTSEPSKRLVERTFPHFDDADVFDFFRGYYYNG